MMLGAAVQLMQSWSTYMPGTRVQSKPEADAFLSSHTGKTVFFFVFMQGCPKCKVSWHNYADAAAQLQKDFPGKYDFMHAEAREFPWIKKVYNIKMVPAFLVFRGGKQVYSEEHIEFATKDVAYKWLIEKAAK